MIELYYTGSLKGGTEQTNFAKSTGGYISSTKVPNGNFNNLFSSLSLYGINNIKEELIDFEIIGLGLKNISSNILKNVTFWVEKEDNSVGDFYIGIVEISEDANGQYIERIPNRNSLPYYAEFHDINGINKKVNIGDLAGNKVLGLWIKRIIPKDKIENQFSNQILYNNFKAEQKNLKKEIIHFKIEWL